MKDKTAKEKTDDGSTTSRPSRLYTGGERPIDPEDLVMASGRDVTPERVERAKRLIEEKGPAAVERYLP
ncbi:hypothetical protein [Streptomyces abikoensis]